MWLLWQLGCVPAERGDNGGVPQWALEGRGEQDLLSSHPMWYKLGSLIPGVHVLN